MQDRRRQFDEIFLQRTAGPYIRVKSAVLTLRQSLPVCPDKQTFSENCGMSQRCQCRKSPVCAGIRRQRRSRLEKGVARAPIVNQYEWLFRHLEGILITRFGT